MNGKKEVFVANATRRIVGTDECYAFPTKILMDGVGSTTVEFVAGTEELVDFKLIDGQNRYIAPNCSLNSIQRQG